MKYLITLGDIPERIVELQNLLQIARTLEKRGEFADPNASTPDETLGNIFCVERPVLRRRSP